MRAGRRLFWALLVAAGFAACDLNPQPLPPGDENGDRAQNGGSSSGGGSLGPMAPAPTDNPGGGTSGSSGGNGADAGIGDAGTPPSDDAGDAGDASDATTD